MSCQEEEKKEAPPAEDIITQDGIVASSERGVDYEKLLDRFGCQKLTPELVARLEKLTGQPAHPLIRRGFFYSHRDLDQLLNDYEAGKGFYLYTGRGPSSENLHLGHAIPMIITQWLQEALGLVVVIQLTDDEKYLYRPELSLKDVRKFVNSNIKDIIAFGFDVKKTFIFADMDYIHHLYPNVLAVQKHVTYNQLKGIFGVNDSSNAGKIAFPAVQAVPAFSSSFPHIFGSRKNVPCLIPQAIDQDPYFRMTRDIAPRIGARKPSCMHSKFFPALQGPKSKMSASLLDSAIFVKDSPADIKRKINKKAFSGGQATVELQQELGADIEVDVPVQYLRFFWNDDEGLSQLEQDYKSGTIMSGHVKAKCIEVLTHFIKEYQARRKLVTDEMVREFTAIRPIAPFADMRKPPPKEEPVAPPKPDSEAVKEAELAAKEKEALAAGGEESK